MCRLGVLGPVTHVCLPGQSLTGRLGVLHLFADLVTEDLVPVDLSACDRQLAPQGLEGGLRHGLVVVADGDLRHRAEETPLTEAQDRTVHGPR